MRVYLCLFGCYRTFKKTRSALFTNLINNNTNCIFDIYVNTEYNNVYTHEKWDNDHFKQYNCSKEKLDYYFKDIYGSNLKNVTYFTIANQYDNGGPMIQRIRNSISTLETENNYDLYLFMRIDCILSKKLNLYEYTHKLNNDIVKYICRDVCRGKCSRKDHERDWDMGVVSQNIDNIRKLVNRESDFNHLPSPNDEELRLMMKSIKCNNDFSQGIVENMDEYKKGWWYGHMLNTYSFNKTIAPLWYEDDFFLSIIR